MTILLNPDRPVVTILTRVHPDRLGMLVHLADSIRRQTTDRVEWVQIDDPGGTTGRPGIARMNLVLARYDVSKTKGAYIWVVDDDDRLESSDVVAGIASTLHTEGLVPWLMVKAYLGSEFERHNGVWPQPWGEEWRPAFGKVSMLNLVVRRDVFALYQSALAVDIGADSSLARSMWDAGLRPVFYDLLAARTQRISDGREEPNAPEVLDFTLADPEEGL